MASIEIVPDQVFVSSTIMARARKMRRVVGVFHGVVCYSNGGDKNRFCKIKTIKRWVASNRATITGAGK